MAKGRAWDSNQIIDTQMEHSAISFDEEAFDAMLHSQGMVLEHYMAMRCPLGMVDIDDNRRPQHDHALCSNGFLYAFMGDITTWMQGNTKQQKLEDYGYVNGASCFATFPRYYDKGGECDSVLCGPTLEFLPAPFDRFYLKEKTIVVPTWQTLICSGTGFERLSFPAVRVIRLVDWRGVSYYQGKDFGLTPEGQIAWKGTQPIPDTGGSNKAVISVRYVYRPFWYVARMQHEIRVSQSDEDVEGNRELIRNPQQVIFNREYLFLNEQNQGEIGSADQVRRGAGKAPAEELRQDKAPPDGGFGPR